MARTSNQTLPNVMLEKGVFDNLKVLNLLETYGCVGFTVWVSLLFKIADDKGYYTQMSPSLITSIQKDIGNKWVSRDKIIGVINGMLECELLDSSLFKQGVLTSVGIQRRYLDVKRKSRAKGFSTEKYWLLGENQADSPVEYNNDEIEHNNADKCSNNADRCSNNPYIKVREENNSSSRLLSDDDYAELCDRIGKNDCDYYIDRVKAFKEKHPEASFAPKATILKWHREDTRQGRAVEPKTYTAEELNEMFTDLNANKLE